MGVLKAPEREVPWPTLTLAGFFAGIIFWGGLHTGLRRLTRWNSTFQATRCAITFIRNTRRPFTTPTGPACAICSVATCLGIVGLRAAQGQGKFLGFGKDQGLLYDTKVRSASMKRLTNGNE